MIRLAHLSDLHLTGDPATRVWDLDSEASFAAVLDAFTGRADAAVLTGDLADAGQPDAYRAVAAATRGFTSEVHAVAGNHDDPDAMRAVLGIDGTVRSVPLGHAWTLVLLSSWEAGAEAGNVDAATRQALAEQLARARGHVVVAVHHPPASTCVGPLCGMVNGPAVLDTLVAAGNVRAVLSGHLHDRFAATHDGIELHGAPSTVIQLEHHHEEPHYRPSASPPAAHLVELHDDGTLRVELVEAAVVAPPVGNIRPVQ